MKQDYETRAYMAWNLEDAHEELSRIVKEFRPDAEIDGAEFSVRMAHLYGHLNTAWNVQNLSAGEIDSSGGEKLNDMAKFPKDIEPF